MNESKISVRYAKALFEAALSADNLDIVRADILMINEQIKEVEELKILIESPVISTSEKRKAFKAVFSEKIQKLTMDFIDLMTNNKREFYLESAFRYFNELYKKSKAIKSAEITTAVTLDSVSRQKIETIIRSIFKVDIELTTKVNEDIIGGLVIRVDDQQYDLSVASKLREIENSLLNA